MNSYECNICDEGEIHHANNFQQTLANAQLNKQLINYLVLHVVAAQGISTPCSVYNGNMLQLPMLENKNGEADYNVWYHCMASSSTNMGSDTDIWVYGMIFKEGGWFHNKTVYVERSTQSEYVSLNTLSTAASYHPQLKRTRSPLSSNLYSYRGRLY